MKELTWQQSEANKRQVGADHYKNGGEEHWDRVARLELDYFQGQITKYVERCWKKNGIEDLEKALHFLQKYIEVKKFEKQIKDELAKEKGFGELEQRQYGISTLTIPIHRPGMKNESIRLYEDGEVLTTGWAQFVFEGTDSGGNLFTCRECKEHFHAPVDQNPYNSHECHGIADKRSEANITGGGQDGEQASQAYVNQG